MAEKNSSSPIPTGFTELDNALGGGLPRGVLTILTSPFTAEGKTSLAVSVLRSAFHQPGIQALMFSLEGTHKTIGFKLLAMETGVDTMDMGRGSITEKELARLNEASESMKKNQFWIDDNNLKSTTAMREHIADMFDDEYPDMIVIDYLDLMSIEGYHGILAGMRLLARDSNAAILVVAHTIKERLTREIMMQHAPTLLVLHRDELSREAQLDVWQRHTTKCIPLYFYPPTTRFFNSEEEFRQTYQHTTK